MNYVINYSHKQQKWLTHKTQTLHYAINSAAGLEELAGGDCLVVVALPKGEDLSIERARCLAAVPLQFAVRDKRHLNRHQQGLFVEQPY